MCRLVHHAQVHFNHRNFTRLRERDSGYVCVNKAYAVTPDVRVRMLAIKGFIKHGITHSLRAVSSALNLSLFRFFPLFPFTSSFSSSSSTSFSSFSFFYLSLPYSIALSHFRCSLYYDIQLFYTASIPRFPSANAFAMIKGSRRVPRNFHPVDRNIGDANTFSLPAPRPWLRPTWPRLIMANGICIAILRMSVIIMRCQ